MHRVSGAVATQACAAASCTRAPLKGATVRITGDRSASLTTDAAGAYEVDLPDGSSVVTPEAPGATFGPASRD